MIAEALEMQGYEVQVAYGPLSAILIAVLFQPELAILDVDAPTMDGYELAAALRVDLPECKFIALTGGATELGACVANEQAFTAI
jgi:CheY-like chemotaxis protein